MALPPINIEFYLDGRRFALRSWHVVPRVGDEIMFGPERPKLAYRIKRVVWGVEGPEEDRMDRQAVNIEIERV